MVVLVRSLSVRNEKTHPGEVRPGGPFITICLVGAVADVDVAVEVAAPLPARAVAIAVAVEVAVMAVMVVVVMAVVMMAVVVVMTMAMAVATAVAAAGRRVTRGGERRNRQHNSSGSGGEDSTLHFNFSWGSAGRPSPWLVPVSASRSPKAM
jgi:uncharacterized membrane protein YgcG